jgi:hypothetical protein
MLPNQFQTARTAKVSALALVLPVVASLWAMGISKGWL